MAEQNGNIVFLHKIVEGSASRSYGIHVAKLAGIPRTLLERAQQKLSELESGSGNIPAAYSAPAKFEEPAQLSFFAPDPVAEKIKALNLMEITPSQAIKILEELKEEIHD